MCNPVTVLHPEYFLRSGESNGYRWEVARNSDYYRCGYVCIPPGHPWHGKSWQRLARVEVYGGISSAEPAYRHCESDGWWIGFEAWRGGDRADVALMSEDQRQRHSEMETLFSVLRERGALRTTEFVVGECERVIEQAVRASRRPWHRLIRTPAR